MIKRRILLALTVAVAAGSCSTGSTDSAPVPTEPWVAARTLPIEVFWKNTEESIEVVLSADAAASAVYFSTRLNNIDGPDRVAIGINDSPYVSVNKDTVETDGLGEGQDLAGDFKFPNTRDIRFKVPAGALKAGTNTVRFKYGGVITDPNSVYQSSMGYRVLKLNFKDQAGQRLLPESAFRQEDPAQWSTTYGAEQVARGKQLWYKAQLAPNPTSTQKISASCNDCHVDTSDATHDGGGYDLKYFNYSNHAIVSRAQFHQLSQAEGEDIAAYIRSLPTPASKYGRPWNPPYQPGPEINARPVSEWAAGAGIDAVLTDQSKLVPLLFPSGTISDAELSLTSGKKIDLVSLPSFPLLDWNEWLPAVHPKDARRIYSEGQFAASELSKNLTTLKNALGVKGSAESEYFIKYGAENSLNQLNKAEEHDEYEAFFAKEAWDEIDAISHYALAKYRIKEVFGLMQKYDIEGRLPQIFGAGSNTRGWLGANLFVTNAVPISRGDGGRFQITKPFGNYTATAWYHLQAIVNMGDINRQWTGNNTLDGAYILNINSDFLGLSGFAGGAQLYALSLRMMQERASYNVPSLSLQTSYDPHWGQDPTRIFMQSNDAAWRGIAPADKTKMLSAIMKAHYEYLERFPVADFRSAGLTQDFETINGNGNGLTFLSRLRAILMYMHADDPTSTLKNEIARKADLKFPGFGFSSSALGNGGFYVAAYLARRETQGTDPKTGQPIYTYPASTKFAPGATIRIKGFWHTDGKTPTVYKRAWVLVNGVEKLALSLADYPVMSSGDGIQFSIPTAGNYIVNVMVETEQGVISGTRETLEIL